jgi:YgiT-type zinc finger domain-containing protein
MQKYNKCSLCNGEVIEERVTVDYRWGGKLLAVLEDVPAGVCQNCGEEYYRAEVVQAMEELAKSKKKSKAKIIVPIYSLNKVA